MKYATAQVCSVVYGEQWCEWRPHSTMEELERSSQPHLKSPVTSGFNIVKTLKFNENLKQRGRGGLNNAHYYSVPSLLLNELPDLDRTRSHLSQWDLSVISRPRHGLQPAREDSISFWKRFCELALRLLRLGFKYPHASGSQSFTCWSTSFFSLLQCPIWLMGYCLSQSPFEAPWVAPLCSRSLWLIITFGVMKSLLLGSMGMAHLLRFPGHMSAHQFPAITQSVGISGTSVFPILSLLWLASLFLRTEVSWMNKTFRLVLGNLSSNYWPVGYRRPDPMIHLSHVALVPF